MNHRGPPGAEPAGTLALFPSDAAWARTRVLDAQAIETCDFDLDAFARFRRIRILTYSSSVQMLHTVLKRFAESRVECVLGCARVVNNVASIIALQTAAFEEVHNVLRGLPASSRDDVLERVRDGRLHVRVVEGHVSHAKIFLLSDGPDGDRCVLTGSANFSTSALLGDQHEVLIRFRDDRAWEHFERQYLEVRDHASADVPIAGFAEQRIDPDGGLPPDAAPVLPPAVARRSSSLRGPPKPQTRSTTAGGWRSATTWCCPRCRRRRSAPPPRHSSSMTPRESGSPGSSGARPAGSSRLIPPSPSTWSRVRGPCAGFRGRSRARMPRCAAMPRRSLPSGMPTGGHVRRQVPDRVAAVGQERDVLIHLQALLAQHLMQASLWPVVEALDETEVTVVAVLGDGLTDHDLEVRLAPHTTGLTGADIAAVDSDHDRPLGQWQPGEVRRAIRDPGGSLLAKRFLHARGDTPQVVAHRLRIERSPHGKDVPEQLHRDAERHERGPLRLQIRVDYG